MARSVAQVATRPPLSLAIEPMVGSVWPALARAEACHASSRAASISHAMSARANEMAWFMMIGRPKAWRSLAYSRAYSSAARAMPTAWAPTPGRVSWNTAMAGWTGSLRPSRAAASRSSNAALPPSRQLPGMRQSSSTISAVWLARMPCFLYF